MEKYEKPVMEIELFDETEQEILTTGNAGPPEDLLMGAKDGLPSRQSC